MSEEKEEKKETRYDSFEAYVNSLFSKDDDEDED
jgi:hypothetical protein